MLVEVVSGQIINYAVASVEQRADGWYVVRWILTGPPGEKDTRGAASCDAVSASPAVRLARLAGVGVDDVLAGRFPPPGTCPHCGHRP